MTTRPSPIKATATSKPAVPVAAKTIAAKPAPTKVEIQIEAKPAPKAGPAKRMVSAQERYRMVAEAAYFIAEKRGLAAGDHAADWAKAEAEIAAKSG